MNHPCFKWQESLIACRGIARTDCTLFNEKTIIADDSLLGKTGQKVELVSYQYDHTTNRSKLGYQMLQIVLHNGSCFYPLGLGFRTSKNRPDQKLRQMDKRTNGWKRREKKTGLLVQMLRRSWQNGISARFVLFDSWLASDKVISKILEIGYGGICRLKANKTQYRYKGEPMTLPQLWHTVARHKPQWISF